MLTLSAAFLFHATIATSGNIASFISQGNLQYGYNTTEKISKCWKATKQLNAKNREWISLPDKLIIDAAGSGNYIYARNGEKLFKEIQDKVKQKLDLRLIPFAQYIQIGKKYKYNKNLTRIFNDSETIRVASIKTIKKKRVANIEADVERVMRMFGQKGPTRQNDVPLSCLKCAYYIKKREGKDKNQFKLKCYNGADKEIWNGNIYFRVNPKFQKSIKVNEELLNDQLQKKGKRCFPIQSARTALHEAKAAYKNAVNDLKELEQLLGNALKF